MALTAKRITENFKELEDLNNEAFPKEERVSIERMIDLSQTGISDLYGVYDEDTFVGFFMTMTSATCVYLFYLAIRSSLRSRGYGGRTLKLMDDLYQRQIVLDMERISDYCENISEFAESLLEKQVDFSEVGVEHLNKMLDVCIASYLYALEAFESNDRESALKTIEKETEADGLEISLRAKHIKRLTNQQCNTEAGVVFLDSLVCLERISDHARNIAEEVLAE